MFEEVIKNDVTYNLNDLKEFFRGEINSNRRFEEISSLEDLIHVLHDRKVLSKNISQKLGPDVQYIIDTVFKKPESCKPVQLPFKGWSL